MYSDGGESGQKSEWRGERSEGYRDIKEMKRRKRSRTEERIRERRRGEEEGKRRGSAVPDREREVEKRCSDEGRQQGQERRLVRSD
jgi:hypothetical protein